MEIVFLGTGAAWCVPEHSCQCAICTKMEIMGEERSRTSFFIKGKENILVDCGPDVRMQMRRSRIDRPDLVLISHEHGDHYLGLDDLLAFRRSLPADSWIPIPVYASEQTWQAIEIRFGYLLGSLIEKRIAFPGQTLEGIQSRITPFKTYHGPTAPGSVGYIIEYPTNAGHFKLVYTSDFIGVENEPESIFNPDILIIQSHWLNEPEFNRPHHMSFQRAINFIRRWQPRVCTYLVHISDADLVPGDPYNNSLKKIAPENPLKRPNSDIPYPIPKCQQEWQAVIDQISKDYELPVPVIVSYDEMRRNHT